MGGRFRQNKRKWRCVDGEGVVKTYICKHIMLQMGGTKMTMCHDCFLLFVMQAPQKQLKNITLKNTSKRNRKHKLVETICSQQLTI